jgi:hypothetical protein
MGAYEVQPAPAQDLPAEWNKPPTPDPPPPPADDRPVTSSGNGTAPVTVTDAALLAGLRRTLANRHGRRYSHRFLAPGTLRIRWVARRRTIASLRIVRPQAGTAALRVRPTRFGKRLLARGHGRLRVSVRGSFARAGHPALRATRRALVRRG